MNDSRRAAGRMRGLKPLLALFLALLSAFPAMAAKVAERELQEAFHNANALFRQANDLSSTDPHGARERYAQAALQFEFLIRQGGVKNGHIYYDLGNTYFLMGDLGKAILNYKRARLLIPGDQDLARNMEYVRSRRMDKIVEGEPQLVLKTLLFWHYDIPIGKKRLFFVFLSSLFWLLAAAAIVLKRPVFRWPLVVTGALALLLLGSLAVDQWALLTDRSGVILSQEVVARKGDGETYEPAFQEPLHAGTEFTLVEKRPGWWNVRLADGRSCWLPESAAEMVRTGG